MILPVADRVGVLLVFIYYEVAEVFHLIVFNLRTISNSPLNKIMLLVKSWWPVLV
jgi:hypothetical protein